MSPFPDGVAAVPVDDCGPQHDKPRQHLFAADLLTFEKTGVSVECLPAGDDYLVHVTLAPASGDPVALLLDPQDAAGVAAMLAGACAAQLAAMHDEMQGDLFEPPAAADPDPVADHSPASPIGAGVLCPGCDGRGEVSEPHPIGTGDYSHVCTACMGSGVAR